MKNVFKKMSFIFILIFLLCLSISTIYADELNEDSSKFCVSSDLSDLELSDISDINDDLSSEDAEKCNQIYDEGDSKKENLLSSDSDSADSSTSSSNDDSNSIWQTSSTEVLLVEDAPEGGWYILDSITKYPNSKVKFNVHVMPYLKGTGNGGTVTLTFNGKSYTANVNEGSATIVATTPSKVGSYKAKLTFNGYDHIFSDGDIYRFNSSVSYFTLKIKKIPTVVSAAKVTAKHKQSKYFTVKIKNKVTKKVLKNTQIILKVYTGKKYKTYKVKTNSKGVAKINTKKLSVGNHKVVISSGNKNYIIKKTSKITIKKSKTTKKRKKVKYYVYKTKTKYLTAKFGHNVQTCEEEKYTKKGWKLVKYWWGKKTYYDPMLGYWHMVYGKFKKTYKVKVAKYKYV